MQPNRKDRARRLNWSLVAGAVFSLILLVRVGWTQDKVVSSVHLSNSGPQAGDTIRVTIRVDMTGVSPPNNLLGSFSAALRWDPAVLTFVTQTGLQQGFIGDVNATQADRGELAFGGANPTGVMGTFDLLESTFTVSGLAGDTAVVHLEYSAMAAARTFTNLLPFLVTNDDTLVVQSRVVGMVRSAAVPSKTRANTEDTLTVAIVIDMSDIQPPDSLLGSFTGNLQWDASVLQYVKHSQLQSGFVGATNADSVQSGELRFNGVNANGIGGEFVVLEITFRVTGEGGASTALALQYSAMAAAGSFTDLRSAIVIEADTISVNHPPVAEAGLDTTYVIPKGASTVPVTLDGSRSFDPDGIIVAYHWSGADDPDDLVQPVVELGVGTHVFSLVVEDNDGATSGPDSVTVLVEFGVSVDDPPTGPAIPDQFYLAQNFPNPFNPQTRIRFGIPTIRGQKVHVTLVIFNVTGQVVRLLSSEAYAPGSYEVLWDGLDSRGAQVPSGLYFYRLTAGEFSATRQMLLLR